MVNKNEKGFGLISVMLIVGMMTAIFFSVSDLFLAATSEIKDYNFKSAAIQVHNEAIYLLSDVDSCLKTIKAERGRSIGADRDLDAITTSRGRDFFKVDNSLFGASDMDGDFRFRDMKIASIRFTRDTPEPYNPDTGEYPIVKAKVTIDYQKKSFSIGVPTIVRFIQIGIYRYNQYTDLVTKTENPLGGKIALCSVYNDTKVQNEFKLESCTFSNLDIGCPLTCDSGYTLKSTFGIPINDGTNLKVGVCQKPKV